MQVNLVNIESIEEIEELQEVYDVEMDHETHRLFANGILVHNSGYVSFGEVINSVEGSENLDFFSIMELIFQIVELRLQPYTNAILKKWTEERNVENLLDFELETISDKAIWLAKKNYILDIVHKDGVNFNPTEKISIKGFETVQSSTPPLCRKKLKELVKIIFKNGLNIKEVVKFTSDFKKVFMIANVEEISESVKINDYELKVLQDNEIGVRVVSGCAWSLKAAAYYNHLLNSNSKYKSRYNLIKSGDKVKTYIPKNSSFDNFAYIPNEFPHEFAPEMDREAQFQATFIGPLNRILTASGYATLDSSLITTTCLF